MSDVNSLSPDSISMRSSDTSSETSTASSTPTTPSTAQVIATAFSLDPVPRFFHLLVHVKSLISSYGPYTTYAGTTVFTRAPIPRSTKKSKPPSDFTLATSFAAAQDSVKSAQPDSPSKQDLQAFSLLWTATREVMEKITADGSLSQEVFGWGIIGLSAGYTPALSSPLFANKKNRSFESLKGRLHAALTALPSLNAVRPSEFQNVKAAAGLGVSPADKLNIQVKAWRETHICAQILLQRFKMEGWEGIRWGHGIMVVERWLMHLGLDNKVMEKKEVKGVEDALKELSIRDDKSRNDEHEQTGSEKGEVSGNGFELRKA